MSDRFEWPTPDAPWFGAAINHESSATGVSVLAFPNGANACVDIRGGSVGTVFTPEKMVQGDAKLDALVFSGGGIMGFNAIAGVLSGLWEKRITKNFLTMPLVSGGVIFDFGTHHSDDTYPTHDMGRQAITALKPTSFPVGATGAGCGATLGKMAGLDAAVQSGQVHGHGEWQGIQFDVMSVVNAVGHIKHADNSVYPLYPSTQKIPMQPLSATNTTLSAFIVNVPLWPRQLQQLTRQVHGAMSQCIEPYGTLLDGDVMWGINLSNELPSVTHPTCLSQDEGGLWLAELGRVIAAHLIQAVRTIGTDNQ